MKATDMGCVADANGATLNVEAVAGVWSDDDEDRKDHTVNNRGAVEDKVDDAYQRRVGKDYHDLLGPLEELQVVHPDWGLDQK